MPYNCATLTWAEFSRHYRLASDASPCQIRTLKIHRLVVDNQHILYDPGHHLVAEKAGFRMVK